MNAGLVMALLAVAAIAVVWWLLSRHHADDPPIPCYRCLATDGPTRLASWETRTLLGRSAYTAHLCWECATQVNAVFLDDEDGQQAFSQQQNGPLC